MLQLQGLKLYNVYTETAQTILPFCGILVIKTQIINWYEVFSIKLCNF